VNSGTARRGFASMDPEKRKEVASKGGKAVHALGSAHKFTSREARAAARQRWRLRAAADPVLPCLQCPDGAKRLALCRGLCLCCYKRSLGRVRRGETTWPDLERAGLALPGKPRGSAWRAWRMGQ
jgi:hypothetical protein